MKKHPLILTLSIVLIVGTGFFGFYHLVRADITTGLVAYWTFDEGSGTTAADSSGNNNTGTLSGASLPTWVTGKIGPFALNFGGSTSYVNVTHNASIQPTAITVSAWIRGSSFPNAYNGIVQKGDGSTYYEYFIKSNGKVAVYTNIASYDGTGSNTLSANTWYMVTFTYDSTNGMVGYVNGASDGTAAAAGALPSNTADLSIGRDGFTSGRYWNGDIDDVRIYNRALSASDVAELYAFTGVTRLAARMIINSATTRVNSATTQF